VVRRSINNRCRWLVVNRRALQVSLTIFQQSYGPIELHSDCSVKFLICSSSRCSFQLACISELVDIYASISSRSEGLRQPAPNCRLLMMTYPPNDIRRISIAVLERGRHTSKLKLYRRGLLAHGSKSSQIISILIQSIYYRSRSTLRAVHNRRSQQDCLHSTSH